MKKLYSTIIVALLCINGIAQVPHWAWATGSGSSCAADGFGVATDNAGNVYSCGEYCGTLTLGSFVLTNPSNTNFMVYVVKYGPSGNVLWATSSGGTTYHTAGFQVATDSNGNVYVCGSYDHTITFGSYSLTATTGVISDLFLVKYDSFGNVVWANTAVGSASSTSLTVDKSNNIYITGYYQTNPIAFGSITLPAAGIQNVYLTKYDSNGNVIWAKCSTGYGFLEGNDVKSDNFGNIYVTGIYDTTITFGSFSLPSFGVRNSFIVKYDSLGNVIWAKGLGNYYVDARSVAVNSRGKLFITGQFFYSFVIGSDSLFSMAGSAFVVELDSGGNPIWAKQSTGNSQALGYSLATDTLGNVFMAGRYLQTASVIFDTTTLAIVSGHHDPMFIVKYNYIGDVNWAIRLVSGGDDQMSITADNNHNIYLAGDYADTSQFILGTDTLLLTGQEDPFLAKLHSPYVENEGILEITNPHLEIIIYPNPFTLQTTIIFSEEQKNTIIKITDVLGKEIKSLNFKGKQLTLEKGEMKPGIYFVQVTDEKKNITNKKIVVQ